MTGLYRWFWRALVIFALLPASPAPASAGTPLQVVRDTIDRLVAIVQAPADPDSGFAVPKRTMMRRALRVRFDFSEMARMSLGNHWEPLAGRQREFVSVFGELLEHACLARIESLRDARVVYVRELVDRKLAQVDTKVVPPLGEDIPVNYRLHLVGGEWKVYDVLIGNVSIVENYRAQFYRVLKAASFDILLLKLHEKLAERDG